MKITYRPVERRDYDALGEIINQAFALYRYVPDEQVLASFKRQYVYSCLAEATYTCVAELEGQAVGVIMGHAGRHRRRMQHLSHAVRAACLTWRMKQLGRKCGANMADYEHMHRLYAMFSARHKGEFDGVLTLFAVNENCRGQGVGKTLMGGLHRYLAEYGTRRVYLYTDSCCNYGFYEHQGLQRLEAQRLDMTRDGQKFGLDVFLYGWDIC